MGDSGNSSGLKILASILVVVVICAIAYYATVDGIVETIKGVFKGLVTETIEEAEAAWDKIKGFLGISVVKNGMYIYPIDKDKVSLLKEELESKGVDTDTSGTTEVMLRKILLTQAVTSSTQDTLCIAEIGEEEILKDTEYTDLNEYFNSLSKKKSKDEWPISDYNYNLYYITDHFFYFQDKDDMMGKGADKYYLGIMGTINIKTETGDALEYVSEEQFKKLKSNYENEQNDKNKDELLHHYTIGSDGQMKVYKIIENTNTYSYIFTNDSSGAKIEKKDIKDGNSTYNIVEVPLSIQSNINTDQYAVSVELLMNFLDISASPEYIDEFIDYAIEKTKITITGYALNNEEISYTKQTANIQDNFIFELYDMVNGIDNGGDNIRTYKSLIYDRIYKGTDGRSAGTSFDYSVVKLPDFEDIDYGICNGVYEVESWYTIVVNGIGGDSRTLQQYVKDEVTEQYKDDGGYIEANVRAYLTEKAELYWKNIYSWSDEELEETVNQLVIYVMQGKDAISKVGKISEYLQAAYDPGAGFSLGDVTVEEVLINKRYETSWTFCISSISTWFGNITYGAPIRSRDYSIDATDCNKTEYDNFNESKLTDYKDIDGGESTRIVIYDKRAQEAGIGEGGDTIIVNSADIFDNVLSEDVGENKNSNFSRWTLRGLGLISMSDGGKYSDKIGAGSGSDYLYTKYAITNAKRYNKMTKFATDNIEEDTNLPQVDVSNVKEFLALWKNETGEIGNKVYTSDGKKVKYKDIYHGTSVVGDMFESAPEMTFELLESSDSTKNVVDIFKYIMYIYTGIDYGITEESQIAFMFNTNSYSGSDYIVNTSMSDSNLVLTKDQLEKAIKNSYRGNTQKNLLSCVDDFMYIQENNKVNAVFAAAATIIKSSGGTNWAAIDSSTYNWYSIKGSYNGNSKNGWRAYSSFNEATRDFGDLIANSAYYFKAGKYTVTAIAPTYCNEEWGNSVVSEMTKIYNSIGISGATGGTEGTDGNVTTFTVGNRTYKNYKQIEPSYKSIPLACYSGSTLYNAGCGLTSDAIIGSGFGSNSTPVDVNRLNSNVHPSILKKLTGKEWIQYRSFSKTAVINELKKGNPVIVRYEGNGGFASSKGHFVAILSISEDGSKMYVSNPATHSSSKTGWLKTSYLDASGYCQYIRLK